MTNLMRWPLRFHPRLLVALNGCHALVCLGPGWFPFSPVAPLPPVASKTPERLSRSSFIPSRHSPIVLCTPTPLHTSTSNLHNPNLIQAV
jgi:hypothetical protein